jgi:hypothetical protein
MPTNCSQGLNTPVLDTDPCNGERVSAGCVVDPNLYSDLGLPINSTQQQINQALYLALKNLQNQINAL